MPLEMLLCFAKFADLIALTITFELIGLAKSYNSGEKYRGSKSEFSLKSVLSAITP